MVSFHASVFGALVASVAFAHPLAGEGSPVTLPLQRHRNVDGRSTVNVVDTDRTRYDSMLSGTFGKNPAGTKTVRAASVAATNALDVYTLSVGVGSPPTQYNLIVDTGSSNTWVGAGTPYKKTSTSHSTGDEVGVTYGSGAFYGLEYIDQVTLGPGLVIAKQSIGVAEFSEGFTGFDGILGIGPTDLTAGTLDFGLDPSTIPTVSDNLYTQKTINPEVVGVYFAPSTTSGNVNGELTFGGVDTTKTTSAITYTPITNTSPASEYWGINQEISYGATEILNSAGIVDTGTTLVMIASDAFSKYMAAIPGSTVDETCGLLMIPASSVAGLKSLYFVIGGATFNFSATDQLLPQALNTDFGCTAGEYYSVVSSTGTASGSGLDFINGFFFIQRFYSVFDTTNHRVGFATTKNS